MKESQVTRQTGGERKLLTSSMSMTMMFGDDTFARLSAKDPHIIYTQKSTVRICRIPTGQTTSRKWLVYLRACLQRSTCACSIDPSVARRLFKINLDFF